MLVLRDWLQKNIGDELPSQEKIVEGLTFHAFEIDGLDGDVIDVDVLPNRAYDCLSHRGIAGEIAAIFELSLTPIPSVEIETTDIEAPQISLETELCSRYIGVRVEDVNIVDSPEWLVDGLKALDQRAISSVVDATNYCLNMYGQPLHAFDADKVVGGIVVRQATEGEKMTTLDGTELELSSSDIVIADDEGVLALAGVKGGKKAEVTSDTKNLILEAALFDGVSVRATSRKVGIRTDASKRFENGLSVDLVKIGMEQLVNTIADLHPEATFSVMTDVGVEEQEKVIVTTSQELIRQKLGLSIKPEEIVEILGKINVISRVEGDAIISEIPSLRLDLNIPEDIIEEIGRLYGYEEIISVELPATDAADHTDVFKKMQYVRSVLEPLGFSEIYTPSFVEKGEVKVTNPLAQDRPYLRNNLTDNMEEKIAFNLKNLLFDTDPVAMFEVGTVFGKDNEEVRVVIGIGHLKAKFHNKSDDIEIALKALGVGADIKKGDTVTTVEFSLDGIDGGDYSSISENAKSDVVYKPFSLYPRIMRDIALFVPEGTTPETVGEVIDSKKTDLCVRGPILFDEFHKDGKVSLAFRLIFQSYEKTLSDDEVNVVMDAIYAEIGSHADWEVR